MQIDAPVITVLIPTYQRPHLLRRAIRSVLDQTYPNLRVAVYDNASGDETAAVVAEIAREDPRVIYHCHAENIGQTENFTYAMEQVDTPFFSFLADDDFYLPTFFATAMAGFIEHPDAMCSAGAVVYITERGGVLLVSSLEGYFVPPDGMLEWVAGKYPSITGFVFRREVIERVGTMDTAILHADYDYLLRVLPRFPHILSATPCMVVVYHDQQSTKRAGIDVRLQSYRHLQKRIQNIDTLPADIRVRMEDDLYATFVNAVFTTGLHALCDKDFTLARDAVAALRDPFGVKRKATILALVTTTCQKSSAIRRFLCLLRTLALTLSRYLRARKYRTMGSELKDRLSAIEMSRA